MKKFNITNPKKYEVNGKEKTFYAPVGTIRITDKGTIFVEMNDNDKTFVAFEDKPKEQKQEINF